jgi:ABC-type polysaccharide/polyol phosphate export permease
MLIAYGHHATWMMLLFPLLLIIESILIQGFSLIIATWNVFYRDVNQITGVILTLLFWITPIFYKSQETQQKYQFLFNINPVAILIKSYRDVMFFSKAPDFGPLLYAIGFSLAIGAVGFVIYNRELHDVVDNL